MIGDLKHGNVNIFILFLVMSVLYSYSRGKDFLSGVILALELVQDRELQTPFPTAARIGHRISLAAMEQGVLIRPVGDVLVVMPAPAMPAAILRRLLLAIEKAMEATL